MDEDDLKEDILDDDALALTEAEKAQFLRAVLALKTETDTETEYRNEAWEQLLQLVGAQHAVQLQRPGVWLSVEQLLQKAEERDRHRQTEMERDRKRLQKAGDEMSAKEEELAAVVAAKDDLAATVAAQEEELAAAVAAKDDLAAVVAAQEEELTQLRAQLEKLEGVPPHVTTSPQ